ncbi:hypothetical protein B0H10DRAFT_1956472 [Mycena sp. CBHHK59/15]|nr:hypothetical protein B0H10DRAFT_1956472 [Mycena sp. CBHHK59/15]
MQRASDIDGAALALAWNMLVSSILILIGPRRAGTHAESESSTWNSEYLFNQSWVARFRTRTDGRIRSLCRDIPDKCTLIDDDRDAGAGATCCWPCGALAITRARQARETTGTFDTVVNAMIQTEHDSICNPAPGVLGVDGVILISVRTKKDHTKKGS